MTATSTTVTPLAGPRPPLAARWRALWRGIDVSATPEERRAGALAAGIIALWGGAVAIFGYGGLIVGALCMVAIIFAALVLITRG